LASAPISTGVLTVSSPFIADGPEFDPEIDGKQLEILGRLLAAALGRATAIRRTHERQQALLGFANTLAKELDEQAVYLRLAEFLHREIHGAKNDESKVAIARITFRSGILECVRQLKA
jgi:uncharacterized protein YigA (DUF484 family)